MAVRLEPPRLRPSWAEPARYPGLTPEERGVEPLAELAPPELAPPLWVAPSDIPAAARPVGFVALPPEPPATPAPPEADGLFDVPGLLERLWLARALEASHHDRPASAPSASPFVASAPPSPTPAASRSGGVAVVLRPIPFTMPVPAPVPAPSPIPPARLEARSLPSAWPHAPSRRPSNWVCPYCYLANDPAATTCRGCRSGSLHL
jgi:ribosomal protein L40E